MLGLLGVLGVPAVPAVLTAICPVHRTGTHLQAAEGGSRAKQLDVCEV
jgi:hypothetical protein